MSTGSNKKENGSKISRHRRMIGALTAAVLVVGGIVAALVVTLGGSNDNGDSTDGGAFASDCVGKVVPEFPPLPSLSNSTCCHALEEFIGNYYTAGNVDVDGRVWTGSMFLFGYAHRCPRNVSL